MFYIKPTKNAIGFELWGSREDLSELYDSFSIFFNNEMFDSELEFDSCDRIISGVLYEIRKAFNDSRLKRKSSHLSYSESTYYGCCISWVQGIFFIQAIRYKQNLIPINKLILSHLLEFEYWMEKAMYEFDSKTAFELKDFITGRIDASNDCLYIYMRKINLEYFLLNGGKKAFKALPGLLEKACYGTLGYNLYRKELERDAKRLNANVTRLELNDDDFDYENVKW
ncbi:hypothetical protein HX038_15620 [Myroides odoratimimus]|uniref:DUF6904 family protein n=1 Tax=Myroides odoratimimus TaxID=76832 RepID=UPI0025760D39|nr:hypothetical protein [Myroides odoratimimus]MDM1412165.1 hypothetical protein [Myroides odoratimimus]